MPAAPVGLRGGRRKGGGWRSKSGPRTSARGRLTDLSDCSRIWAAHGAHIGVHMTYVPTDEGWLYRVGHKDLCTRKIVGHAMGERMTRNLVIESLLRAVETTGSCIGLLHHSDKGSQYCSHEYRKMLDRLGMKTSMSGTGNCYDNAPMESF